MKSQLPLAEVKAHLSALVARVHDHHERVTLTVQAGREQCWFRSMTWMLWSRIAGTPIGGT